MEGDGERVHSIPTEPRRKVLRAGVRIVADQFAPYSDEPEEEEEVNGWFDFSKITAGAINANKIQAGIFTFNGPIFQGPIFTLPSGFKPEPPPTPPMVMMIEEKKKQDEPGYVKLTRLRRRR